MKKVIEEQVELTSDLRELLSEIHFVDTFSTTNHIDDLQEITNLIFDNPPKWLALLFKIRNSIVKIVGLKTDFLDDFNDGFQVGGYIKFFKIYSIADNHVVLGADDSHLNFRAVIKRDNLSDYNIKVITLVEFNNKTGRYYMNIIKPFHRIVVKQIVKRAFKNRL